jgi:hypothetical protein
MRTSFDLYWDSKWTERPDIDGEEPDPEFNARFLDVTEEDIAETEMITRFSRTYQRSRTHQCNDLSYITDYPGSGVNYRRVYPAIVKVMNEADEEVVVEAAPIDGSPGWIARMRHAEIGRDLHALPPLELESPVDLRVTLRIGESAARELWNCEWLPCAPSATSARLLERLAKVEPDGPPLEQAKASQTMIDRVFAVAQPI